MPLSVVTAPALSSVGCLFPHWIVPGTVPESTTYRQEGLNDGPWNRPAAPLGPRTFSTSHPRALVLYIHPPPPSPSSILHPKPAQHPGAWGRAHFQRRRDSTTTLHSHTRLATRQRQSRLMARQQQARRPEDQQTNQCESWLGRPIRVGWLDGHLHFTRGGCCGAVCGFCGSRPLVRWFWFPPRPRHQPRGETTNTTGTVAAADEHTSPAKLPCRRAVGSSRQVAVIVPTGPRIEADAANFIVARLA